MKYNKLVRDKIPEILKEKGLNIKTHISDNKEYWEKLKEKLNEEVKEFLESESVEEMADVFEVITAMNWVKDWNTEKIAEVQKRKRDIRGGFRDKIILDETNE